MGYFPYCNSKKGAVRVRNLLAQCSASRSSVAATLPCSALLNEGRLACDTCHFPRKLKCNTTIVMSPARRHCDTEKLAETECNSVMLVRHKLCSGGPQRHMRRILQEKNMEKRKFWGGISPERLGGYRGPTTFSPWLGTQENKVFCAGVLDPKARTSTTPAGVRKASRKRTLG